MKVEQSSGFLGQLLGEVRAGKAVPATFQRPYVWGEREVEELWASILDGLPIGTFLTWRPGPEVDVAAMGRTRIGPVEAVPDRWSRVILDGQNRLASYAWSLRRPDDPLPGGSPLSEAERATWCSGRTLVADPEEARIRFVPSSEADLGWRLPAGMALDGEGFNAFVRRTLRTGEHMPEDVLDWYDGVQQVVRSARVMTTTIEGGTPLEALSAFRRIARSGVPMSEWEFEAALAFAFADEPAPRP